MFSCSPVVCKKKVCPETVKATVRLILSSLSRTVVEAGASFKEVKSESQLGSVLVKLGLANRHFDILVVLLLVD